MASNYYDLFNSYLLDYILGPHILKLNIQSNHDAKMLTPYQPLLIIILFSFLFSWVNTSLYDPEFLIGAMGYCLCLLSMFKFFNLEKFAYGFSMYDIIAQRIHAYGYLYPLIELYLGLACITNWQPFSTNILMLLVILLSTIGVIQGMRSKQKIQCACMGTVLDVPLSTISLLENVSMMVFAVWRLIKGI